MFFKFLCKVIDEEYNSKIHYTYNLRSYRPAGSQVIVRCTHSQVTARVAHSQVTALRARKLSLTYKLSLRSQVIVRCAPLWTFRLLLRLHVFASY